MLVKGIIVDVLINENKVNVRLPVFETAGSSESVILTAPVSYTPGNLQNYRKDDVVFVEFENDQFNNPVILGKLYTGKENNATNYSYNNSLEVTNNAILPENTKIGEMSFKNILNNLNILQNLQNTVSTIEKENMPIITFSGQNSNIISSTQSVSLSLKVVKGSLFPGDEIVLSALSNWYDSGNNPRHNYYKRKHKTIYKMTITEEMLKDTKYINDGTILFKISLNDLSIISLWRKLFYSYSSDGQIRNTKYIRIRRLINADLGYTFSNIIPLRTNVKILSGDTSIEFRVSGH